MAAVAENGWVSIVDEMRVRHCMCTPEQPAERRGGHWGEGGVQCESASCEDSEGGAACLPLDFVFLQYSLSAPVESARSSEVTGLIGFESVGFERCAAQTWHGQLNRRPEASD